MFWPFMILLSLFRTRRRSKPAAPRQIGSSPSLLHDLGDDAGADGAAAFADGEAQLLFHGDRHDQLDVIETLSPGITISVPSGSFTTPVTSVVRK